MNHKLFSLLIIVLLGNAAMAQTTRTVTNTANDGAGSFRQAISAASTGDVIAFSDELTGNIIPLSSTISISKSLTINGNGVTISGGGNTKILNISGNCTVKIKQVHFTNGSNAGNGGAIEISSGATTEFSSCLFSNNKSQYAHGGVFANVGGNLNITACSFYLNATPYGAGAAVFNNGGNTALTGNLFYGNTAFMEPKIINVTAGTAVSNGYNVSDLASNVLNKTTDKMDGLNAFVQVANGEPNTSFPEWENLLQIVPSGLENYPTEDFYGLPRTFPATAGAIDVESIHPGTPVDPLPYPGGSGVYNKLVWNDEFDTDGFPGSEKWSYEKGFVRNDEIQYYTEQRAENIGISNGILTITARKENVNIDGAVREITSASIHTNHKGDWKYGRIEVRAKMPAPFNGTWPAIWMLFSEPTFGWWPNSGEIDIMEHVGYTPDAIFYSLHAKNYFNGNPTGDKAKTTSSNDNTIATKFHVYAVEWFPDRIDWYFDSEKKFSVTNPNTGNWEDWPFDHPFYLILNLALGGSWGGAAGVNKDALPAAYQIDYVRVFQNDEVITGLESITPDKDNVCVNNSGEITVYNSGASKISISLFNLQGQFVENVFAGAVSAGESTFHINPAHQGIYILKLSGSDFTCSKIVYVKK
jgi:beta-glucanase (GH16 family)